jgi:hypothetical protein
MDESAYSEPQDVSSSEAIELTRQALRNTRRNLRTSDELLSRSRALRSFDEPSEDDEGMPGD